MIALLILGGIGCNSIPKDSFGVACPITRDA
jgi:hypothetical protein